jgi:exopolysaccharide biosynthesis polyprenyl glycosylphosphotransferase
MSIRDSNAKRSTERRRKVAAPLGRSALSIERGPRYDETVSATVTGEAASFQTETLAAAPTKRRPKAFGRRWAALLILTDVTMFILAALTATEIFKAGNWVPEFNDSIVVSTMIYAAFWLIIFERLGLYRQSFATSVKDEIYYTAAALALGALPQFVLFTIVPSVSTSRSLLLLSVAIASVTVGTARALLHASRARLNAQFPPRIAVVGHPSRLDLALASLNFPATTRLLPLVESDVEATLQNLNLTQDHNLNRVPWLRQARAWGADTILMTEILPPHVLPLLLETTARDRIKLAFAPPRLCAHAYEYTLRTDGHQALIVPFRLSACRPIARVTKRAFDIVLAAVALIIASPVMLAAAAAIMIDSGAPIFFTQQRVGRNGHVFDVLKFRTMRVDAEGTTGPVWASARDPRKTRLGSFLRRTSIDELPQILNVLRGEMSIVGPRPERPVFVEEFHRQLPRYDERHLVRPGITGWSQVHMKRVLTVSDVSEKLSHDLFYIENWSFFMDVSVVVKTAAEFLFHRAG